MRHRIKSGKVGSFTPEKQKVEVEQLEDMEVADEVEEIFEEDSNFSNDDEACSMVPFGSIPCCCHLLRHRLFIDINNKVGANYSAYAA